MKTEKETDFKVKEIFKVGKKTCAVVEIIWSTPLIKNYHNGYVSVLKENFGKDYNKFSKIKTEELTFGDTLNRLDNRIPKKMWFLGFDTAHYWNDLHPESKTFESVKERTIKLAKEMIKKKV